METNMVILAIVVLVAGIVINKLLGHVIYAYFKKKRAGVGWRYVILSAVQTMVLTIAIVISMVIVALQIPFIEPSVSSFLKTLPAKSGSVLASIIFFTIFIIVGVKVSQVAVKLSGIFVVQSFGSRAISRVILRGIKYAVVFLFVLLSLPLIGVDVTPLIATAGFAGIVIGFAAQPIISSVIAGFFILHDKPYEIGDRIEIRGTNIKGYVEDITIRTTKIRTVQGNDIVISNTNMVNRDVINYSIGDPRSRVDVRFSITYESDLDMAIRIIEDAALNTKGVLKKGKIKWFDVSVDTQPKVVITNFGDNGIELELRFWVEDYWKYWATSGSEVKHKVFKEFKKHGIVIPYPHRHIVFDKNVPKSVKSSVKSIKRSLTKAKNLERNKDSVK